MIPARDLHRPKLVGVKLEKIYGDRLDQIDHLDWILLADRGTNHSPSSQCNFEKSGEGGCDSRESVLIVRCKGRCTISSANQSRVPKPCVLLGAYWSANCPNPQIPSEVSKVDEITALTVGYLISNSCQFLDAVWV